MNKKIGVIASLLVIGVGGWLFYRSQRNKKIDSTPINYTDALNKLEKI